MNKHSTVKKNIISFQRDASFYATCAETHIERGEYFSALDDLRRAIRCAPGDDAHRVRLAQLFAMMDLLGQSNDEYFALLAKGKHVVESYFGLTQNFMAEENIETAYYYLKRTYEMQREDIEDLVDDSLHSEAEIDNFYSLVEQMEEHAEYLNKQPNLVLAYDREENFRSIVYSGTNLMRHNNYEHALEMLAVIPAESGSFVDAQNNCTLCAYALKRYDVAKQHAAAVRAVQPDNVFCLCNLLMIYKRTKEKEAYAETLEALEDIDMVEENDLYRMAMTMCELKEHEKAAAYFDLILMDTYDEEITLLAGIAHYNCGNKTNAMRLALAANRLDADSGIPKYYAEIFSGPKRRGALIYGYQVQAKEGMRRLEIINEALTLTPEEFCTRLNTDAELYDIFCWSMTLENYSVVVKLYDLAVRSANFKAIEFLKKQLRSSGCNNFLKKQLLCAYLSTISSGRIHLVVNDVFRTLSYHFPKAAADFPAVFRACYVSVFATLSLMEKDFESKLLFAFKTFLKSAAHARDKMPDPSAMSVILSLLYGEIPLFQDKAVLCEIYNTNLTTVRTYLKLMKLKI